VDEPNKKVRAIAKGIAPMTTLRLSHSVLLGLVEAATLLQAVQARWPECQVVQVGSAANANCSKLLFLNGQAK